ncbi:DUF4192 domain-containing protein [Yimella sp. cx-573]|nr:DUF4192 domain-containing protein [Yimella sp. cx-573]
MRTHRPLRGQGQLLTYIPYQLRFRPVDSVVLCGFDRRGLLLVVARFDPLDIQDAADAKALFASGKLAELDFATLVVFGEVEPLCTTVEVLRDALESSGALVAHLCAVQDDHWWALECSCGECPRRPVLLPAAEEVAPAVRAIVSGADASIDRADIEALARPDRAEAALAEQVRRLLATGYTAADLDALGAVLTTDAPWSAETLAAAVETLDDIQVRDAVLHCMCPREFAFGAPGCDDPLLGLAPADDFSDTSSAQWAQHLAGVARCVPTARSAQVWAMVAALEWAGGGGALATVALDAALTADPEHRLAGLVRRCLHHGAMPRDLTEVRTA